MESDKFLEQNLLSGFFAYGMSDSKIRTFLHIKDLKLYDKLKQIETLDIVDNWIKTLENLYYNSEISITTIRKEFDSLKQKVLK